MTETRARDLGEATERDARRVGVALVGGAGAMVVAVVATASGADGLSAGAVGAALACTLLAARIAWFLPGRVHQVREGVMLDRLANDPATRMSLDTLADDVAAGRVPRDGKTLEEYRNRWGK